MSGSGVTRPTADAILAAFGSKYSQKQKAHILSMLAPKGTPVERAGCWDDIMLVVAVTQMALVSEHHVVSKTKRDAAHGLAKKLTQSISAAQSCLTQINGDAELLKYLASTSGIFEAAYQKSAHDFDPTKAFEEWRARLLKVESSLAETSEGIRVGVAGVLAGPEAFEAMTKLTAVLSRDVPSDWPPLRRAVYWLWEVWERARGKPPTTKSIRIASAHNVANVDATEFNAFLVRVLSSIAPSSKTNRWTTKSTPRSYLDDIR